MLSQNVGYSLFHDEGENSGMVDPTSLEAFACCKGLALAANLVVCRIQVASNCKNFIDDIIDGSSGGDITCVQAICTVQGLKERVFVCH